MEVTSLHALFLLLILASFSEQAPSSKSASGSPMVMKLIHRDSPRSPLHNPNVTTRGDLWRLTRHRSSLRHNYIQSALTGAGGSLLGSVTSPTTYRTGEYITRLIIGTPPFEVYAIMDTGSDMIWVECLPCKNCSNSRDAIFDPSKSVTFEKLDCQTVQCEDLPEGNCTSDDKCGYHAKYIDGSYSIGYLSSDNFTMATLDDEVVSFPDTIFGCASEVADNLRKEGVGIIGLSRSHYSLIGQLGLDLSWKFSYCLEPRTTIVSDGGDLVLGDGAVLIGDPTPMVAIWGEENAVFYLLKLVDMSVGGELISVKSDSSPPEETLTDLMVIDSGTTYTLLATNVFEKLFNKLREVIKLTPIAVTDPDALCFVGSSQDLTETNIPVVTFHFQDLDVHLPPTNTFVEVDDNKICLAMEPTTSVPIFGNVAQQNMSVGYDLEDQKIYIAPTGC